MDHQTPQTDIGTQLFQTLFKYAALIGWILLGLIGRFSFDLFRNKRFTWKYFLGCTGAAIIVGYVGGSWVLTTCPDKAPMIIPTITMLANNIVSAVMLINWKAIIAKDWKGAFEALTRKKD